jgi:outer membrane protein OmpA-like peptidoglycan-associated protein
MTGSANRLADDTLRTRDYIRQRLPGDVDLFVPVNGTEAQLLGAIAQQTRGWVNFDRIRFATGSATLDPSSAEQVDNIAAILRAYPNVHLRIAGFTDNVGSSEENMKLSWARADAVKNDLASRGIGVDRLIVEGLGEASSDNDTVGGRADNRSVAVQITQQ